MKNRRISAPNPENDSTLLRAKGPPDAKLFRPDQDVCIYANPRQRMEGRIRNPDRAHEVTMG